ncbi:hypothetical protein Pmani_015455 [Petrolisthes manimaculis]|uniref:Senescence domain-containing protein n=1 Tax=Petrolisthes manimaculis TaxID=1843537 RepID=A0AAE1PS70_9EUCA|nr:hypothetical protein Pmani_015455 [Petrolisthes manimaculis]
MSGVGDGRKDCPGVRERSAPNAPPPTTATPEQEFEHYYHEAYVHIDRGITLVTQGHKAQAEFVLQQGLTLLDKALGVKVEGLDCTADKVQQYTHMQHKMKCTRKEVLCHFAESQTGNSGSGGSGSSGGSSGSSGHPEPPPSYDDYLRSLHTSGQGSGGITTTTTTTSPPVSYPALGDLNVHGGVGGGGGGGGGLSTPILSPQQGEMIFQVDNGVQIFFIYPDGRVTSPSYPAFLAVFTFNEPIGGGRSIVSGGLATVGMTGARGFLQVGEWSYPLVPAHSPVLHSFYGAYMFPDVNSGVEGTSVGVILPDSVDKETRQLFEQILTQLTQYQQQSVPPGVDAQQQTRDISASTSERIAAGAEVVSQETLKTHIQPEVEKREIDPKWHKTAKVARDVSGSAVKVSGYLLGQVGKATMALGRRLAPHLQHQGTKAITHITGQGHQEAAANMDGVLEVAAGAVKGASTIYISLEAAAATLATNITDNTVKVVTHKYGDDVGCLADNTLYAVGQTAMVGHNLTSLGVKGVAKRAAKDTGKAILHQHEAKKGGGGVEEAGGEVEEANREGGGVEKWREAGGVVEEANREGGGVERWREGGGEVEEWREGGGEVEEGIEEGKVATPTTTTTQQQRQPVKPVREKKNKAM